MDYGFFKAIARMAKDVKAIKAGICRLEARNTELDSLHQQITELINAAAIEQAEKDKLNAKLAVMLGKSASAEDKMRAVLASNPA